MGGLLVSVALGYVYPVEAAACGAVVLFLAGLLSGHVSRATIGRCYDETLRMTGALFALLAAATTLTLVFRLFGTDKLIATAIQSVPGGPVRQRRRRCWWWPPRLWCSMPSRSSSSSCR